MDAIQLSLYQALQLLALGPCLFMLFFLCVAGRHTSQIFVPVLYFSSLTCSFFLPLRDLFGIGEYAHAALLVGASAAPFVSFLLIVQCMTGSIPKAPYWAVLAIPLIGGSQIVYATIVTEGEVCIYEHLCTAPMIFRNLYDIFSISLICLVVLLIYRRLDRSAMQDMPWRVQEKYALVLALVVLNLALLGIDLAQITHHADIDQVRLAKTVVRIGFIYLVLTLLFRMFDRPVELAYERIPTLKPSGPSAKDIALAEQIRMVFAQERLHRDMGLTRAKLARKLAVTEATLSRVANTCFRQNVSMLINHHRVEEAKERLAKELTPITVIAFEVGFASIPSFNRVFKQFSHMPPSEYRQIKSKLS